jgi:hypothetical protein
MWWVLGEIVAAGLLVLAVLPIRRGLAWLGAAFTVAFAVSMSAYVFGLDTSVNNGRSRWANKAGISHTIYFAAMGVTGFFIALLLLVALRRGVPSGRVRATLAVSSAVSLIIGYLLVLAFDND